MDTFGTPEGQLLDNTFAHDNKLYVRFYKKATENESKSLEAGRPIFDETDFIRIMVPGDKTTMVDREVHEVDAKRFSRLYKQWKEDQTHTDSGTPLEAWPQIQTGQVAELKAMNVHTVEALAALSDGHAVKIMGSNTLREKAQTFISASKDAAFVNQQAAELAKRDQQITLLMDQVAKLDARLSKAKAKDD